MIEERLLEYLSKKLDVPVYLEERDPLPVSYVTIENTGGAQGKFLQHTMVSVKTYGPSLYEAADLAKDVRTWMLDFANEQNISACDLNAGPYNFTDTSTKRYRYQAVYDITYMED
jgi:hypothetical protein